MYVSTTNIIRFPLDAAGGVQRVQGPAAQPPSRPAEGDNVVAFPPVDERPDLTAQVQEHGLLFAAQRIVGRVADQLEQAALL